MPKIQVFGPARCCSVGGSVARWSDAIGSPLRAVNGFRGRIAEAGGAGANRPPQHPKEQPTCPTAEPRSSR